MKKMILSAFLCAAALNAQAFDCQRLGHTEGKTHEIGAELLTYTHIVLPENIMEKTQPIVGNPELWTTDTAGSHLYIKPNSSQPLGKTTSFSVIGESGASYDFLVTRQERLKNNCYKLADGVLFSKEHREALRQSTKTDSSDSDEVAMLWKEKYLQQQQEFKEEKNKAILTALRQYRYQIYTRYNWTKSGISFIGNDFISDIYDDGRFTYIRVNKQNKGLMMIEATLEGQTELIEAKYDTISQMYTVAGIYPEFTMKYGKTSIEIERNDNETAGDY